MGASVRMPLVEESEFDDRMREVAKITKLGPDGQMLRHYGAFMNNPEFLERWSRLAGTVLKRNTMPERHKLMVIMKVAFLMKCAFAWTGRQAEKDQAKYNVSLHGRPQDFLSASEMSDITRPAAEGDWQPEDRAVLQAVEDTWSQGGISTPTWEILAANYERQQLFDLTMIIGYYLMTESMINSLGVEYYKGLPNSPETFPFQLVDNGSR